MQQTYAHYKDNEDVVFLSVQTVFEGFGSNTAEKVAPTMKRYGLEDIAVGHDAGTSGSGSEMMRRYRSGGTPWVIVIGRKGVVRYNSFSLPHERAVMLIDELLSKKKSSG